jgi:zinc D-Ala-D-Ala dipeptidase
LKDKSSLGELLMRTKKKNFLYLICALILSSKAYAETKTAPKKWSTPKVRALIAKNVLYFPIAHESVKNIPLHESDEALVDLLEINNPRIKPLSAFNPQYTNTYEGYSKVRRSVYEKLVKMLDALPKNIGIAYFEGFRPLHKQKEYFDNKLKEVMETIKDKHQAYQETCKHVSPFIDNVPTHTTGAAIDMTLFEVKEGREELIDMGKFDVIFGPNDQQETFSKNTTPTQRANRLMLLEAAATAGLVNYGFEWWHYSYGDKAWAYVKREKQAIYGLATKKDDPILSIDKETYLKGF